MKVFKIQPDKRFDVHFRVIVYPNRKRMIAGIKKDNLKIPGSTDPDNNYMAMFRPFPAIFSEALSIVNYPNSVGSIYFNLEDISHEAIAHECAHAAFTYEFNIRHSNGDFSDDNHDEQEEYCYFLGRSVKAVTETIMKYFKGIRL